MWHPLDAMQRGVGGMEMLALYLDSETTQSTDDSTHTKRKSLHLSSAAQNQKRVRAERAEDKTTKPDSG